VTFEILVSLERILTLILIALVTALEHSWLGLILDHHLQQIFFLQNLNVLIPPRPPSQNQGQMFQRRL
jgi:hypothetical protein